MIRSPNDYWYFQLLQDILIYLRQYCHFCVLFSLLFEHKVQYFAVMFVMRLVACKMNLKDDFFAYISIIWLGYQCQSINQLKSVRCGDRKFCSGSRINKLRAERKIRSNITIVLIPSIINHLPSFLSFFSFFSCLSLFSLFFFRDLLLSSEVRLEMLPDLSLSSLLRSISLLQRV